LLAPKQILPYGFRRDQSTRAERAAIERRQLDIVEYEEVAAAPATPARQAYSASRHGASGYSSTSTST
jgi:hypothetical protein